jgi:peptidoglycan hydrolase-like protein with peptidoglycan-binding domain
MVRKLFSKMRARPGALFLTLAIGAGLWWPALRIANARSGDSISEYQQMLIWTGDYDGIVDGVLGAGTKRAIIGFQKRANHSASGTLTTAEATLLIQTGSANKKAVGFERVDDHITGISVGMPLKLVSGPTKKTWGQNWSASDDSINIDTFRYSGVTIQQICNRLFNYRGRNVTYFKRTDDLCIVAGEDRDNSSIYIRAVVQGTNEIGSVHDIRGISVRLVGEASERLHAIPIAMSSTFSVISIGEKPSVANNPPKDLLKTPTSELKQIGPTDVRTPRTCFNGLGDCPPSASVCLKDPDKCPTALPGNK